MKDNLILVNREDNEIGHMEKEKCHDGKGVLHRAFSIFIFNKKGELLIQQRSKYKRLWPLYWSNTCCSHPRIGEELFCAANRRLKEECGMSCNLNFLYKFRYNACYRDEGSENELCSVLVGFSEGEDMKINPEEIAGFEWINLKKLIQDIIEHPSKYTPWFKIEIKKLIDEYWGEIRYPIPTTISEKKTQ